MKRRKFIGVGVPTASLLLVSGKAGSRSQAKKPMVISTWSDNQKANAAAWKILAQNGRALDAVHEGVMVPEADPDDSSVGLGGLPDRDGRVTLDACIMDHLGNCGSVMALEHIVHAISVARLVMEKTPHVQIVGDGALQFALTNGFKKENLLTPKSEAAWKKWLATSKYDPMITVETLQEKIKENHDTIGMLALDAMGNLSGACTTSGLAFKMHGRVGDSPIIGAGLFVDNEVGAATATGVGEEVVRIVGSHTIVEAMRYGKSPEEACKESIRRLIKLKGENTARELQVGFIAINKKSEVGCYSMIPGFTMAVHDASWPQVIAAKSWFIQ